MRVPVSCTKCLFHNLLGDGPREEQQDILLELREDGAYVGTCPKGHAFSFAIQWLRYEMLYEAGGVALVCGFNREAISSMATALERYYEFATRVLAEHHGVNATDVDVAWKSLATSSERQLGAFLLLYLATFRTAYSGTNQKMIELRNDVVHKGGIPSRDQALAFGEYVYGLIRNGRDELERLTGHAVIAVENRLLSVHAQKLKQREKTELPNASDAPGNAIKGGTMLRWWGEPAHEFTYELEALAYRVRRAGAGTVVYPETYTKFDPNAGDEAYRDEGAGIPPDLEDDAETDPREDYSDPRDE